MTPGPVPSGDRRLTPLSDLLDGFVGRVLARAGDASTHVIWAEWSTLAVGEWEAATPVRVEGKTLLVEVDNGAAATGLRYSVGALLGRIEARIGDGRVTDIKVRIQRPPRGRE